MDPASPDSAHRIVADYARVLEGSDASALPASIRHLPYPKQTIKAALLTCVAALRESRQLDADMRQFLEEAYVALADYVDDDVVRVMSEYRAALAAVEDVPTAKDKVHSPGWRRVADTSRLAGDIARAIAADAAALRHEFRAGADARAQ